MDKVERKVSIPDLAHFIQQRAGLSINADKVLKEPDKNKEAIWTILVHLVRFCLGISSNLKINIINPELIYLIDAEKHQQAVIWCNEYGMLMLLFKKLGVNYGVDEYLKGDKELSVVAATKMYRYKMFKDEYMKKVNLKLNDFNMMEEELKKHIKGVEKLEISYMRMKERKEEEAPKYQEYMAKKAQIESRIIHKKDERKEVGAQKSKVQEELQKIDQGTRVQRLELEDLKRSIQEGKKKIASNGPQVKRQLSKIQNQHQQFINDAMRALQHKQEKRKAVGRAFEDLARGVDRICSQTSAVIEARRVLDTQERQIQDRSNILNQTTSNTSSLQSRQQTFVQSLQRLQIDYSKVKSANSNYLQQLQARQRQKQKSDDMRAEMQSGMLQLMSIEESIRKQAGEILSEVAELHSKYGSECSRVSEKMGLYMKMRMERSQQIYSRRLQ